VYSYFCLFPGKRLQLRLIFVALKSFLEKNYKGEKSTGYLVDEKSEK